MVYKKCTRAEYPDMINMLYKAFEFDPNDEFFTGELASRSPHPDHALDSEIEKHYIAITDGKVVGAVGAYPSTLYVSENKRGGKKLEIKASGIGQVSCIQDYRGRGVMSDLMKIAIDDMKKSGVHLSVLDGDRTRYGHFGYDYAGTIVSFNIQKKRLSNFLSDGHISVKKADISDYPALNELISLSPSYVLRDKRDWEKNFIRKPYKWLISESAAGKGFIGIHFNNIVEAQGDPEVVIKLIYTHMEENNLDDISLSYPEANYNGDSLYGKLWEISSGFSSICSGLMVFISPDSLLEELSAILGEHGARAKTLSEKNKELLLKRLFGNRSQFESDELSAFGGIAPLIYWIPKVDAA